MPNSILVGKFYAFFNGFVGYTLTEFFIAVPNLTGGKLIAVGYGDGYPRSLSGQGAEVIVKGKRCEILGRVTMDMIMVNVSSIDEPIETGDEVILIGKDGEESISSTELAKKAGTIPWEILTGISPRVVRVIKNNR